MGIEANYRRVTAAEWEKLLPFVETDVELDELGESDEAYANIADSDEIRNSDRFLSIDKHWHGIHALLTGDLRRSPEAQSIPAPLGNIVIGGTETAFAAGYGNVRFLNPDEVQEVADALGRISVEDLRTRFDPVAFTEAQIYPTPRPGGWDLQSLESLLFTYRQLVGFFRDAAKENNVVLISFD